MTVIAQGIALVTDHRPVRFVDEFERFAFDNRLRAERIDITAFRHFAHRVCELPDTITGRGMTALLVELLSTTDLATQAELAAEARNIVVGGATCRVPPYVAFKAAWDEYRRDSIRKAVAL